MDWNGFLLNAKRKWQTNEEEFEEEFRKRRKDEEIDLTGYLSLISAAVILETKPKRKQRGKIYTIIFRL